MWHKTAGLQDSASICGARLIFSVGAALNMMAAIWAGVLVGINGVRLNEQIVDASLLLNYAVVVAGRLSGWGLWPTFADQLAQGIATRLAGKLGFLRIAGPEYRQQPGRPTVKLLKILWPMSWHMAAAFHRVVPHRWQIDATSHLRRRD